MAADAIWLCLMQAKPLPWTDRNFFSMAVIASDERVAARPPAYPPRLAAISWIFFDWAAQPYFTLITTFVFAPYFATHVAPDPASGQSLWGFATAGAGLVIALLAPALAARGCAACSRGWGAGGWRGGVGGGPWVVAGLRRDVVRQARGRQRRG